MSVREIIIEAPVQTPFRGHDNIAGPTWDDEGRREYSQRETWQGDRPATSRLFLSGLIQIGFLLALLGCGNRSSAERAASQSRSATSAPVGSVSSTEITEPTGSTPTGHVPANCIPADPSPSADSQFDELFAGIEAGQIRDDNGLKLKLVWCPPGEFLMVSPAEEHGADGVDPGQVRVILQQGFWLGKYELTQAQWKQVMETEPWRGGEDVREGADYPATFVSWDDAMKFCCKLTEQEQIAGHLPDGWQITLPTEAQWEYACRAGTTSRYAFGGDPVLEHAWFAENSTRVKESYAHRVGLKRENAWGLHDMHGNVWELCRDVYDERLPGGRDPEITAGGAFRVIRGGSWNYRAGICRWDRLWNVPSFRYNYVGFRLAWIPAGHR